MSRIRKTGIMLHCSEEQKSELKARAAAEGLTLPNFIRSRIGLPLERHGHRKDLVQPTAPANNAMQPTADSVPLKKPRSIKGRAVRGGG
jgi:hypothetical protein